MGKKRKQKWNKWDYIFIATFVTAVILKVWELRIKANILNSRFIFDFVTDNGGEIFLWENAPAIMQLQVGLFNAIFTVIFAVIAFSAGIIVIRLAKKTGWSIFR